MPFIECYLVNYASGKIQFKITFISEWKHPLCNETCELDDKQEEKGREQAQPRLQINSFGMKSD